MADANDYTLDDGVDAALLAWFDALQRDENFGNAREARRLLEAMRKAQSQRLRGLGRIPNIDELRMLITGDIPPIATMG